MTPQECADHIRRQAAAAGMTVEEFADSINHATREDIAEAMEQLPTDALEWAVRFEALSHPEADSMTIQINVLDELFHFISFDDWLEHAQLRFRNHGHTNSSAICVDALGMVCTRGKHFKAAKFPVRVYAVDEPPYLPSAFRDSPEAV